jgi:hypothetical protein
MQEMSPIDGVRIVSVDFGEADGLPYQQDEVFYIVSNLVQSAYPNRTDLFCPAEVVRDDKGNIIGCKSLSY